MNRSESGVGTSSTVEQGQQRELESYVFASHGVRAVLELDRDVVDEVRLHLPPGSFEPCEGPVDFDRHYRVEWHREESLPEAGNCFRLLVDDVELALALSPTSAANRLESDLQLHIAEFAQPHLFLHAGVVQWHGKLIVLPGSSYAGKSTLVRALVQAGATYYSDEFAVLDAEGRSMPYARRLSHREGPLGPTDRIDLNAHAPVVDQDYVPPKVDIVALMSYKADSEWECTELFGGGAVVAMSEHMVPIRLRPAETLQMLVTVCRNARVYRCVRPNLEVAMEWLRAQVTQDQDPQLDQMESSD